MKSNFTSTEYHLTNLIMVILRPSTSHMMPWSSLTYTCNKIYFTYKCSGFHSKRCSNGR